MSKFDFVDVLSTLTVLRCGTSSVRDVTSSSRSSRIGILPSPPSSRRKACNHTDSLQKRNQTHFTPHALTSEQFEIPFLPSRSSSNSSLRSVRTTKSASTNTNFFRERGKRTSRKRILYPQMMRCFSRCGFSQRGQWYCTNSYSKPHLAAIRGRKSFNVGLR
jgi:hypothetical protein